MSLFLPAACGMVMGWVGVFLFLFFLDRTFSFGQTFRISEIQNFKNFQIFFQILKNFKIFLLLFFVVFLQFYLRPRNTLVAAGSL